MPVLDIIRDSFVGQIVYFASGRRLFQYPEERPGFDFLEQYTTSVNSSSTSGSRTSPDEAPRLSDSLTESKGPSRSSVTVDVTTHPNAEPKRSIAQEESTVAQEYLHRDGDVEKGVLHTLADISDVQNPIMVSWYGPDDPELPTNVRQHTVRSSCTLINAYTLVVILQAQSPHIRYRAHHLHRLHRRCYVRTRHLGHVREV